MKKKILIFLFVIICVHAQSIETKIIHNIQNEIITNIDIKNEFKSIGARSIVTAVLFDKKINKEKSTRADFVGLEVPNNYVYGFGLDFKDGGRNLPNLYSFNEK